ncbi:hypothetical protein ABU614_16975 [Lysobacter firmicutimachus]|uniref:DUF1570 domain-containing protein n=1 Tax=Lysobacter firmicutimachus TaxID=1792846 RepID=A0AAU8MP29_9GAMM
MPGDANLDPSHLHGSHMFARLRRLFAGSAGASVHEAAIVKAPDVAMHWAADTRQPIPAWERIAECEDPQWSEAVRDAYWTRAAEHWLTALAESLGPGYGLQASDRFLLLSGLPPEQSRAFLSFCESARRRIVRNLGELALPPGGGKHVCLMYADQDAYYDYIAHYYPEGGEYAMSGGMFIRAGYGHFALFEGDIDTMRATIAHEMTHALLSHLPIPMWLNEGMAVNTEHSLFPQLGDPRAQLYSPAEIARKHAAFWNPQRIQEFWSGASFLRTDDGNMLSYDLAKKMVGLAAKDHAAFVAFVQRAQAEDGGDSASELLGYPLEDLAAVVLGDGDWMLRPQTWSDSPEGAESGSAATQATAGPATVA